MSTTNSTQYEIGRPGTRCAGSGEELQPGDAIVAALVEQEDGSMQRLDYREEVWQRDCKPMRLFAHWHCRLPAANERRKPLLDHESLTAIFEQLEEADDHRRIAFRYVLALILIRKRMLTMLHRIPASDKSSEKLVVQFRGPDQDARQFEVVDPCLSESDVAEVIDQLEPLMQESE